MRKYYTLYPIEYSQIEAQLSLNCFILAIDRQIGKVAEEFFLAKEKISGRTQNMRSTVAKVFLRWAIKCFSRYLIVS